MIYFIACPAANAVKIGVTHCKPFARLGTAQTDCPLKLELVAICDGGYADEAALHARFADSRIRGEWFSLTAELAAHIATFPKPQPIPRGWHGQKRNRPRTPGRLGAGREASGASGSRAVAQMPCSLSPERVP